MLNGKGGGKGGRYQGKCSNIERRSEVEILLKENM